MTMLRYQWGDKVAQESPAPPDATTAAIVVAGHNVWRGDVTSELVAWARWCALQVAHQWDCPPVVREWLATGEGALRDDAFAAARGSWIAGRRAATTDAARSVVAAATAAAKSVTTATRAALFAAEGAPEFAGECAELFAVRGAARYAAEADAAAGDAQALHLRTLLLRRALPEELWPLIDFDEAVLCDALLEAAAPRPPLRSTDGLSPQR